MKKVVLFLLALSTIVGAQAQFMSSGGLGSTKIGAYPAGENGLGFSGKISTISSQSEAAIDPSSFNTKSKSLFGNLLSRKSEPESTSAVQEVVTAKKSDDFKIGLNKIYFSWNFANESDDAFSESCEGRLSFTFGYSHATNLFREFIYIDYGLAVTTTELRYYSYDGDSIRDCFDDDFCIRTVEARVPVNLMINLKLSNKIYVRPYAGLSFGGNVLNDTDYPDNDTEGVRLRPQYGAGLSMGKIYLGFEHRVLEQVCGVSFRFNSLMLGVSF